MKRSALESALKWLERADRSTLEIENYLTKKKYSRSEIDHAIEEIKKYGYINDQKLADRVANSLRSSLKGELLVEQKLAQRGLESIPKIDNASERAASLIQKKYLRERDSSDPKIWAKAARYLASQGYQSEEIETAIADFFPNSET